MTAGETVGPSRTRAHRHRIVAALTACLLVAGGTRIALPARAASSGQTDVYFDHTEETDFWQTGSAPFAGPATVQQQLVKPWDPNGQLCLFPDGSGRFAIGYNPTFNETDDAGNPNGGNILPNKQPAVGEAIYNTNGSYSPSGTAGGAYSTTNNLHVPGPYLMTSASSEWKPQGVTGPGVTNFGLGGGSLGLGGDIPPDPNGGAFNNSGTFTGCAFDSNQNLFAVDLGTSQGSYPPSSSGRLIEWFKDSGYRGTCIIFGPDTAGDQWAKPDTEGVTTHHVDGTGGLEQPGIMAADAKGNIYVPVDQADPTILVPQGKVLEFSNLPKDESHCPTTRPALAGDPTYANGDQSTYHAVTPTTFIDTTSFGMPFPAAIAWDPACGGTGCWAVDNIFFGPFAVAFFDTEGKLLTSPLPILANYAPPTLPSLSNVVPNPQIPLGTVTPFGMAFDKNGDLFVVDIGVAVDAIGSIKSQGFSAGPLNNAGRLLEYTFNGPLAQPPTVIYSGESYPVSVTTCDTSTYAHCPTTGT